MHLKIDWQGWHEVGGEGRTNAAIAAAFVTAGDPGRSNDPYTNQIFLFAKGIQVQAEYFNKRDTDGNLRQWTGWAEISPGGGRTDAAMAASYSAYDKVIRVLAKGGSDKQIYLKGCTFETFNTLVWAPWKLLSGGFTTGVAVSATTLVNGRWIIVAQKADDRTLWYTINPTTSEEVQNGQQASVWQQIPGYAVTSHAPACVVTQTNIYPTSKVFVFHTGDDQNVYYNVFSPDENQWTGWMPIAGGTTDTAVSAAAFDQWIIVFAKGINDLHHYQNVYDISAGTWSGWSEVPGGAQTDAPPTGFYCSESRDLLGLTAKGVNVPGIYINYADLHKVA